MIPILYESTETAFTSNGLGRLRDCISCVVLEERNSIYECNFQYPVTGMNYEKIQLGRIIAVEHDDSDDVQPFDIVSCSRPINGVVEFHAVHISYRQIGLTASGSNIGTLADAFTALGTTTPANPFSYYTDKTSSGYVAAFDGVPRSVRSILGGAEGSILDAYGGEYEWDKWTVNLWASRGQTRNFTIRYGVNLIDYNEELDYSNAYTSVIPYWVGSSGGAVVQGSQVSSGYNLYNSRDVCVPLDLTDKFETQPTTAQLESMASAILAENEPYMPTQNIEVDFVRLQDADEYSQFEDLLECKLCDTVRVVFPMYNMSGNFKIVKTEYNVLLEKYNSMELGTLSTSLAEALGIETTASDSSNRSFTLQDVSTSSNTLASGATRWITVNAPSSGAILVGHYINGSTQVTVYCARQTNTGAQFAVRNNASGSVTFTIDARFLVYN